MTQAKLLQNLTIVAEDTIEYPLWGGRPVRFLYLDGVGIAPVERVLQDIPQQHGLLDRGYRYLARTMTLALLIQEFSEIQADQIRERLTYIFSPTETALKLRATLLDGTQRQIDCYLNGFLDYPQSGRIGAQQPVFVPLIAPDPTFYDPTRQSVTASLSSGSGNPAIAAAGLTADDWPVFEVTGPITNLSLQHSPVGDRIDLVGTIPAGETWEFDLRPGYKTVRRMSDSANRMSYVSTTELRGFSTLRILNEKTTKIYSQTSNTFPTSGTGVTAASSITVRYYRRFLSL